MHEYVFKMKKGDIEIELKSDVSGVATISGATLTSTAVINGINAAVAYANSIGGAQ